MLAFAFTASSTLPLSPFVPMFGMTTSWGLLGIGYFRQAGTGLQGGGRSISGEEPSNPAMSILRTLPLVLATASVVVAAPKQGIDPGTIQDKVSIAVGQEFRIRFQPQRDQLLQPAKLRATDEAPATVKVKLDVTTDSPIRPPRQGATRPFLAVQNDFTKPLHFRALVRLKGSKEYFEMSEGVEPIPPGESANKCWGFEDRIEEVVLYQFTLSGTPSR